MTLPERLAAYNSPAGAKKYVDEYDKVHRKVSDHRERRLLKRWSEDIGSIGTALDMPSGWGRYLPFLEDLGARVIEADYSYDMVAKSRALNPDFPTLGMRCFGHEIPCSDRSIDLVFSMRLSHHLVDPFVRRQHLRELFRVADKWVIVSYFDHASPKNLLRRFRTWIGQTRKAPKSTLRRGEVSRIAFESGFELEADPFLFRIGSGHRLVLARRSGPAKT
jgi:hypothetical protein